jgi:hypothetical protein
MRLACVAWIGLGGLGGTLACGDGHHAAVDAPGEALADTSVDADPNNPPTLFDTGLCVDRACTQINPEVHTYTPHFTLWADAASKRRWFQLPPGTQIDTTDMDHWVFPVGTKFWKEFTQPGAGPGGSDLRIETRLVMRIGPGDLQADWLYKAYQWNDTQTDTIDVSAGGVQNANGTMHDIPSRSECRGCHENLKPSRILGFQAIQLDWDNPTPGEVDLATLIAAGTLTTNPTGSSPYFPLPADGTDDDRTALGYLHANCGHCHNPSSNVYSNVQMVLRLDIAGLASVATTGPFMTAVNHDAMLQIHGHTKIIDPGHPETSIMIDRFESTLPSEHMPALGSKVTDPTADVQLTTWITNL